MTFSLQRGSILTWTCKPQRFCLSLRRDTSASIFKLLKPAPKPISALLTTLPFLNSVIVPLTISEWKKGSVVNSFAFADNFFDHLGLGQFVAQLGVEIVHKGRTEFDTFRGGEMFRFGRLELWSFVLRR